MKDCGLDVKGKFCTMVFPANTVRIPDPLRALIVSLIIFCALASPARADITTGLIGWWKLDESSGTTMADSSGQGKNGTAYGTTVPADCRIGKCRNFNGISDYIEVGNQALYNLNNQDFSVSAWIYRAVNTSGTENIVSNGAWSGTGWRLTINGSNKLYAETHLAGGNNTSNTNAYIISLNGWHQVLLVRSGTTVTLYLDGVDITAVHGTHPNFTANTTLPLRIGRQAAATAEYFNGSIDDVRIYSRALSAADVQELYHESFARLGGGRISNAHIGH